MAVVTEDANIANALGAFLKTIFFAGRASRWLMILENASDRPENVPERMPADKRAAKVNELSILLCMSL